MEGDNADERETNYIHSLGREIARECSSHGVHVNLDTAYHFIKLKALNPRNGFSLSNIKSRSETQKFIQMCKEELLQDTPSINCIRMQAFWHRSLAKLDTVKETYMEHIQQKSQKLFEELYSDEKEKLIKKIAIFTKEYTDIGNNNMAQNIKEIMNPLKSVFKSKDLAFYETLNEVGQYEYLKVLSKLVGGIRIYQHYYKKGGESIENVPLHLVSATQNIQSDIRHILEKVANRIKQVERELCVVYQLLPGMPKFDIPPEFNKQHVMEIQQIQHIILQYQIYLKYLLSYTEEYHSSTQEVIAHFVVTIEELNQVIGNRDVIPTSEVYNRFVDICEQWMNLQAEYSYLRCIGAVYKTLTGMCGKYLKLTKLETVLNTNEEFFQVDVWEADRRVSIDAEIKEVTLHNLTDEAVLNFRGYCVWTMISTNGVLMPARTGLGVLKYKNYYYGFLTSDAADAWKYNAELNTRIGYEVVRCNPEMVDLLEMFDFLNDLRTEILVKDGEQTEIKTWNRCVQTVTHPIPSYIDKDYAFSVWVLKQRAIQLSKMIRCKTTSMQTVNHSHFRASIGVQCEPDKTKATNTMRDTGVVHETILNYQWGLRGDGNYNNLTLTRPYDEVYQRIMPAGDLPCFEKPCCQREKERKCLNEAYSELKDVMKLDKFTELNAAEESKSTSTS